MCDPTPSNPYDGGATTDHGGNGRAYITIYGFNVSGGGGGASDYGTESNGVCNDVGGTPNGLDGGGTYGKGARAFLAGVHGAGSGAYNLTSQHEGAGTSGIVTFEWIGPA